MCQCADMPMCQCVTRLIDWKVIIEGELMSLKAIFLSMGCLTTNSFITLKTKKTCHPDEGGNY